MTSVELDQKQKICFISNFAISPFINPDHISKNIIIEEILYDNLDENIYKLDKFEKIIIWMDPNLLFVNYFENIELKQLDLQEILVEKTLSLIQKINSINPNSVCLVSYDNFDYNMKPCYGNLFSKIDTTIHETNLKLFSKLNSRRIPIIDISDLVSELGKTNAYSTKNYFRWSCRYSQKLIELLLDSIMTIIKSEYSLSPKCIVLDCDNVLWGGIVSEDTQKNIKLSQNGIGIKYYNFQKLLLMLYHHGIILAISSKNDAEDILSVFENHQEMVLKKEHIALFCINWVNKADNLKFISKKLNISPKDMLFVDDSQHEINEVSHTLNYIRCFKFEPDDYLKILKYFYLYPIYDHEMILNRQKLYQTNLIRKNDKDSFSNNTDYYESLKIRVDIHKAIDNELFRISELSMRSNRCSIGMRYTVAQLNKKIENERFQLFSIYISDKYSDLGLVGAIGINDENLELFCVSCRAVGHGTVDLALDFLKDKKIKNIKYSDTGKNNILLNRFKNDGYKLKMNI